MLQGFDSVEVSEHLARRNSFRDTDERDERLHVIGRWVRDVRSVEVFLLVRRRRTLYATD